MKIKAVYLKLVGSIVATAVVFTAVMGFAHTKSGRPILVFLGKMVGKKEFCPLGYDHQSSLAERKSARQVFAATQAGKPSAQSRDALGFDLGKVSRAEVQSWILAHGGSCHALKSAAEMECLGTFYSAKSATLWLEFDGNDQLVSSRGISKFSTAQGALSLFEQARQSVRKQAGPAVVESGKSSADALTLLLSQASVSADFSNYVASVRVTNMGDSFAVTHNFDSF
jgi:hypothetical protein